MLAGFVLANAVPVFAEDAGDPFRALALRAVAEDPLESGPAIAALRARGPAGLEALFNVHAGMLQQHKLRSFAPIDPAKELRWRRLCAALDAVGQQRDCEASRLYWFTELERAKEAARASGKPILSLRLLGNLNEEFTCANSRFFRTTLYANAKVSQYLRDHFVLHWKSVRPVPV